MLIVFMNAYTDFVFMTIFRGNYRKNQEVCFLFSVYRISYIFTVIITYKKAQMD